MLERHTPEAFSVDGIATFGTAFPAAARHNPRFPLTIHARDAAVLDRPTRGMSIAFYVGVLDTPRPIASLPANLAHTCPVCGHGMAVMVAETPKGRLTQCASCGELDYRRTPLLGTPPPTLPGRS